MLSKCLAVFLVSFAIFFLVDLLRLMTSPRSRYEFMGRVLESASFAVVAGLGAWMALAAWGAK